VRSGRILPPLRPYQREIAQAVLESVRRRQGLSFSVEIARQGGKNEVSARIELAILARCRRLDVTSIKAAPTLRPQAQISLDRLWNMVGRTGLEGWAVREAGNCIRVGWARQLFLSAAPSSNVVGHTADLLLEIDEAQDVQIEKFDKELQPMAASSGATTVFYGTAWDDANLLDRARQAHLAAERRDGIKRHFEYDWQVVAASNTRYAAFVQREQSAWALIIRYSSASTACGRCRAPGGCSTPASLRCCKEPTLRWPDRRPARPTLRDWMSRAKRARAAVPTTRRC
jgi:hypothetical protein